MTDYSTLEVAHHQENNLPEVVHPGHFQENLPRQYYDPSKDGYYTSPASAHGTPMTGYPQAYEDAPSNAPEVVPQNYPEVVQQQQNYYAEYPEVLETKENRRGAGGATICGLKRKWFWTAVAMAILIVIAIVVGVAVSVSPRGSDSKNKNGGSGDGNGSTPGADNSTSTGITLRENTQLASANFTDPMGFDNYLVAYQLSDSSIAMSAWNSSNEEWVVSTVVNGSDAKIQDGTAITMNTAWSGDGILPSVNLFYLSPTLGIQGVTYNSQKEISTTEVVPMSDWDTIALGSGFTTESNYLASYGKQCENCNQYSYIFWQEPDGLWMVDNSGSGYSGQGVIDDNTQPTANTSMAFTFSGTLSGDEDAVLRRSLNLFFRASSGALTQLRMGNNQNATFDVGRDIGEQTTLAVFSTGFNESDASSNPDPLTFQVLSIDPDADDGVQLTYLTGSSWTAVSAAVDDLSDCVPKATMAANTGQRVYCVVAGSDSNSAFDIMEYSWSANPSDTTTFLNWDKVGAVNVTVPT